MTREVALRDFWNQTFSFLDDEELAPLQRVCKLWKEIIEKRFEPLPHLNEEGQKISVGNQIRLRKAVRNNKWKWEEKSFLESFKKEGIEAEKRKFSCVKFRGKTLFFSFERGQRVYKWDMRAEKKLASYDTEFEVGSFAVSSVAALLSILSNQNKAVKIYKNIDEKGELDNKSIEIEKDSSDEFTLKNEYVIRKPHNGQNGPWQIWDLKEWDTSSFTVLNPGEGIFYFYGGASQFVLLGHDCTQILIFNRENKKTFMRDAHYHSVVYYSSYLFYLLPNSPNILFQLDCVSDSNTQFDCQGKITDIFFDAKHLFVLTSAIKGFGVKIFDQKRLHADKLICREAYSFENEYASHFENFSEGTLAFSTFKDFGPFFFRMCSVEKFGYFAKCDKKSQTVSCLFKMPYGFDSLKSLDYVTDCDPPSFQWVTADLYALKFFPTENSRRRHSSENLEKGPEKRQKNVNL